eukprot:12935564-Prorocentrum_lima.AAC.1
MAMDTMARIRTTRRVEKDVLARRGNMKERARARDEGTDREKRSKHKGDGKGKNKKALGVMEN